MYSWIWHACDTDERKKQPIVSLANAIPDPRAMMVKTFNAIVTDRAVSTPRRSVNVASIAILQAKWMTAQNDIQYTPKNVHTFDHCV